MINDLHLPIMLVEREKNGYIPLAAALNYDNETRTILLANQVKMEKFTFGLPPVNMLEALAEQFDKNTTRLRNPVFTLVFSCIARKKFLQQMTSFEYYLPVILEVDTILLKKAIVYPWPASLR
jgi:hypothetical protein